MDGGSCIIVSLFSPFQVCIATWVHFSLPPSLPPSFLPSLPLPLSIHPSICRFTALRDFVGAMCNLAPARARTPPRLIEVGAAPRLRN